MKKNNQKKIEEGLNFIEAFQKLMAEKDEKTVAISLRVPENILTAVKFKAQQQNKKYQSLLIEYIRSGLKQSK